MFNFAQINFLYSVYYNEIKFTFHTLLFLKGLFYLVFYTIICSIVRANKVFSMDSNQTTATKVFQSPLTNRGAISPSFFSMKGFICLFIYSALLVACTDAGSQTTAQSEQEKYVSFTPVPGHFPLAADGRPVPLYINDEDDSGVIRALRDLQSDIERVTQTRPNLSTGSTPDADRMIIAGTIGKNPDIDRLVEEGKLDVSDIEGRWETFVLTVVDNPYPGTDEALVIAGSDKRGTIFGIYELSKQIGVSPWHWWADVPVPHHPDIYVSPEPHTLGEPAVQYRGIFINNENPSLYGWVNHTYGGFNHEFYEDVFELILRQKGNYLWPAMWGKAFYDDDPRNAEMADMYGVVIGFSHHEPMMRSHVEWERYGEGPWNYETNPETLREFWREGIERMGSHESNVVLGMRGDGDEPMSEDANIELLEQIIADQREILAEETDPDSSNYFQSWALYKEVQEYYERGMEVPEDVMLLLTNDNWGNVRLLPEPDTASEHEGGWGMYYHYDYVGGPRNYKWINTVQNSRTWEQMKLTYAHNVDKLWLVNVGDIKPMEYPISFFLDLAWDPDDMTKEKMDNYPADWAAKQFGTEFAEEIGRILTEYTRFNSRRKPELLEPGIYSLMHHREAERIVEEYNELLEKAEDIMEQLPEEYHDAYYQLVMYPVEASANVNDLYVTADKNRMYAEQGRAKTNKLADKAKRHFEYNDELDQLYHSLNDGKWQHMMDQTRIGYTYWQQPEQNNMPEVERISIPDAAEMGVAMEGTRKWWPDSNSEATLPQFDKFNQQEFYIEVFNRGSESFEYSVESEEPWVTISEPEGTIEDETRLWISVDWEQAPEGDHRVPLTVSGSEGTSVKVFANIFNPASPAVDEINGFVEGNGVVSMEAKNFTRNVTSGEAEWSHIPHIGRTHSGMTPMPVLAESATPGEDNGPRLEYDLHLFNAGKVTVHTYLSPTLNYSKNYRNEDGIRMGVSFNDDPPQVLNIHEGFGDGSHSDPVWSNYVANNINIVSSTHTIEDPGDHTLKIWMADTGVVLQKIVIETTDSVKTYLGPPESFRK